MSTAATSRNGGWRKFHPEDFAHLDWSRSDVVLAREVQCDRSTIRLARKAAGVQPHPRGVLPGTKVNRRNKWVHMPISQKREASMWLQVQRLPGMATMWT